MATIQKRVTGKGEARHRVHIRIPGTKPVIKTFGDKSKSELGLTFQYEMISQYLDSAIVSRNRS